MKKHCRPELAAELHKQVEEAQEEDGEIIEVRFPHVVVRVEEEYGYRHWLWFTGMSVPELREWWTSQKTMENHFWCPGGSLPGCCIEEIDYPDVSIETDWDAHIHMDDDTYLNYKQNDPESCETILHEGYEPNKYGYDDECV